MNAIKNAPSRYQMCFTLLIALVIWIIYLGFTLTRNVGVKKSPGYHFINTNLPKRSRQLNKEASKPCLKNAFKDILLVIVYNFPFYDSIPHLVALYKPAFPNLLFCGPPDNTSRPGIVTVDIIRGYLGYECLARAIREHPGYKGYFYSNDDVILKYWNFPDFDQEKIWESSSLISSQSVTGPVSSEWPWWKTYYGLNNCRRACEDVAKMTLAENKPNGAHLLNTLLKNSDGTLQCFAIRSDVFYIPQTHATAFSILSKTFYKQKVFLEIAVPTINRFLERKEDIGRLPGRYIRYYKGGARASDSRVFWHLFFTNDEYLFIHPFKLHGRELDNKFNFVMFKFFLIERVKALTNCNPDIAPK
ncbi:uncharacterized protein LOC144666832 isoform X2 [Oculina patagonica]